MSPKRSATALRARPSVEALDRRDVPAVFGRAALAAAAMRQAVANQELPTEPIVAPPAHLAPGQTFKARLAMDPTVPVLRPTEPIVTPPAHLAPGQTFKARLAGQVAGTTFSPIVQVGRPFAFANRPIGLFTAPLVSRPISLISAPVVSRAPTIARNLSFSFNVPRRVTPGFALVANPTTNLLNANGTLGGTTFLGTSNPSLLSFNGVTSAIAIPSLGNPTLTAFNGVPSAAAFPSLGGVGGGAINPALFGAGLTVGGLAFNPFLPGFGLIGPAGMGIISPMTMPGF